MPLVDFKHLDTSSQIAIWNITESKETLQDALLNEGLSIDVQELVSSLHVLQKLAVRLLLFHLLGLKTTLHYDSHGKPLLPKEWKGHISITHSKQMVAVMYHPHHSVGIDLEWMQEKIHRIFPRFTLPEEIGSKALSTAHLYAYWCTKEAIYKCYGKKNVSLRNDIFIAPFDFQEDGGALRAELLPANWSAIQVNYTLLENYMLAYTTVKMNNDAE